MTSLAELDHVAAQWDVLATVSRQRLPMLSHAWVAAHLEFCLASDDRWLCAVAWDKGRLVGVLPVLVRPHPWFGDRLLELTAIFDPHTRSGDALAEAGREREILESLVATLLERERRATGLWLRGVREGSPTLTAIDAGLDDVLIHRVVRSRGSYVCTDAQFNVFQKGLSANFRGNLRKARNKLGELPQLEVVFLPGRPDDFSSLARFLQLEMSGWKGSAGTAIGQSRVLTDFYQRLTQNLAARGWLEWHELRTDGKTVAAHLAIRMRDSVALIKIAYDEEFSYCAPGNMLMERSLERAFEDDEVSELNCLTDMPWHRNWRMKQADYYDVWVFPRRLSSLLYKWPFVIIRYTMEQGLRAVFRHLPPRYQSCIRRIISTRSEGRAG
jgi:CelD/BcsL family acetyltransferase involved in cellulose biosynthesis